MCRFTGPGVVLIQTRKPEAFSAWLRVYAANKQLKKNSI